MRLTLKQYNQVFDYGLLNDLFKSNKYTLRSLANKLETDHGVKISRQTLMLVMCGASDINISNYFAVRELFKQDFGVDVNRVLLLEDYAKRFNHEKLFAIRKTSKFSLHKLSAVLDGAPSPTALNLYERGVSAPNGLDIERIANGFGICAEAFLD